MYEVYTPEYVFHCVSFEMSYTRIIVIICDVGEGLYWHSTRTAAPAAASRFLP